MKKFLPYILVILVLCVAAGWFIYHHTNGAGDMNEGAFAVKDQKHISKVTLTSTDKKKIELTKVNDIWMVNGKFQARDEMLYSLLEAIDRVTVLCPVPKAAHDNVLREMLERNVKVDVYGDEATPVKTYYVGGPTTDGEGTYMLLEEDGKPRSRPDITYIPGVKGYLTLRFNTDEETWRSKIMFSYQPGEIKAVSIEYPTDEKNSFAIKQVAGDSFAVSPLNEKYRVNEPYQQKYILQYLSFYSSISFEAFDNGYSKKDSMIQTVPYCTITVTDRNNSVNKVNLFHMPVSRRSKTQFDEKGNEMAYDIDHFYAAVNNDKDYVITQYYVLGKILRKYPDFYFKPNANPQP